MVPNLFVFRPEKAFPFVGNARILLCKQVGGSPFFV